MLRQFQSFLFILLVQLFANIVFSIFTIIFNLDFYALYPNYYLAFALQNSLIIIVYFGLTLLLNRYFINSYKYPNKAKTLGFILILSYLIIFYIDINNVNFIRYFLYIHYPIGALFRTITSTLFTFNIKLSLVVSIFSASFGVFIGNSLSILNIRLKKRQLSSLTKKG